MTIKLTGTKFRLSSDFSLTPDSVIEIADNVVAASTYVQSGTGAVTRTVQSRLREVVSAVDFGVVGDGVTDDTEALETAVTAAAGKTLAIPGGLNCLVKSQFDIGSTVRLVCHGATLTQGSPFTGTALVRVGAQNVTIEGLSIVGAGDGKTGITVNASAAHGLTVRGCTVTGCGYGIFAGNNNNVTVEDNYVYGNSLYGIWIQNSSVSATLSNVSVKRNRVDTSHLDPATSNSLCILVRGQNNYFYQNVKVVENTMIMPANPTNSTALGCEMRAVDGGVFSGNYSLNGSMLLSLAICKGVTADGNSCEGATFYGIELAPDTSIACEDIAITDNVIDGAGILNYGIGLQGSAPSLRTVVAGNTIRSTTLYGIYVNDQHDDVVISGNNIYLDTAGSAYGIYVQAASGTIENLAIANNVLNGVSTAKKGIFLDDISNVSICGNVITGFTENGVYLRSETGTVDNVAVIGNAIYNSNSQLAKTGAGTFGGTIVVYGNAGIKPSGTLGANYRDYANTVMDAWGTGSPESSVAAGIGSTYLRTNGSTSTTLYVKESGTGNTGWTAK